MVAFFAFIMSSHTPEFGPDVAVPLKKAIARTEDVTLSVIRDGGISTFRLWVQPNSGKGEAVVSGDILFVGFNQPTYDFNEMNRVIAEVAGRVEVGENTISEAKIHKRDFHLGQITFTEKSKELIVRDTITRYSVEDRFLRNLLNWSGLEVEQDYLGQQSFQVIRCTRAVFYPSRLFAALAYDFGVFNEDDKSTPFWQKNTPKGIPGAMTVIEGEHYQRLVTAPADRERSVLEEIFSSYHPKYKPPIGLTA